MKLCQFIACAWPVRSGRALLVNTQQPAELLLEQPKLHGKYIVNSEAFRLPARYTVIYNDAARLHTPTAAYTSVLVT